MLGAVANKRSKKVHFLFICLFISLTGLSQKLWMETEVTGEILKNLEISLSPQVRFEEKMDLYEYFFDTGLEYDFNKYFSAGTVYRLGNSMTKKGKTETFHRFVLDAKTKYEFWKKLEVQLRLRYTNESDFGIETNENEYYVRTRLKVEYAIKKLNLIPYAACEIYRNVSDDEFDKSRYEAGLKYKLTKKHRIGTFYRIHDSLVDDQTTHILGIKYKLKL
jgi:predicted porin